MISNGPYLFSASFFIGLKGVMFLPSNHTLLPIPSLGNSSWESSYRFFINSAARSREVTAWALALAMPSTKFEAAGFSELLFSGTVHLGVNPNISWKGVEPVDEWKREFKTNWTIGRSVDQLVWS